MVGGSAQKFIRQFIWFTVEQPLDCLNKFLNLSLKPYKVDHISVLVLKCKVQSMNKHEEALELLC